MRFAAVSLLAAPLVLLACPRAGNVDAGPADALDAPPMDTAVDAPPADTARRAPVVLTNGGLTVTVRLDPFGMQVTNAAGRVVLDTIDTDPHFPTDTPHAYGALGGDHTDERIALPLIEGWDHVRPAERTWLHGTRATRVDATATGATLDLVDPGDPAGNTFHVAIALTAADEVRVDATTVPGATGMDAGAGAINRMGQSFVADPDEHFFGLGERYGTVDHRGRRYECWTEESGVGQGEHPAPGITDPAPNGPGMSHIPIPFVLSTRGYGLWLDTTYRTGFALASDDPRALRVYAAAPALHYVVLVHDAPRDTLEHFTRLTGRANLPAPWVFGPRRRIDHPSLTIGGMPEEEALRAFHVPTTMVDDTTHFLPSNGAQGREGALRDWTTRMHALGYKPIAYFNAFVSVTDPRAADLVTAGRAGDFFVRLDDGSEFQTAVVSGGQQTATIIDLTIPAAVTWYQSLLQQALDLGYDGWMLDFGEYLPPRARLRDGRTGWEAHNAFPLLQQRANYDYLRRVRGDDFMFFARSGYTGTQATAPMVWSGDPAASFDDARGLPASVRAAINAGISGIPYWGSDISGYTCLNQPTPDRDLYLRWTEFGALSPDMHDENGCAGLADGEHKWNLWSDAETTAVYGRYASLHTRLIPYLYAAAAEAARTGMPIVRHPVLVHPGEPAAYGVELEYYFGPALYVAPVVRRAATTRDLWLPPGRWVDFWTREPLAGGARLTRSAPQDTLPLFLRAGGVVAMLDPTVDTLAPDARPDVVSMADVAGVLDVRAVIDPATGAGHAALVDGTTLDVTLGGTGAVALPAGVTTVTDDATLATCTACGRIEPGAGGSQRVRFSTERVGGSDVMLGALGLRHHAGAGPLRVRWDVVVLQ